MALHVYDADGALVPIEGEQIKPNPMIWPTCDKCDTAYILRRCLSFTTGGYVWAWQRDCEKPRSTCKAAGVQMHDAKGECPNVGREPGD